MKKFVLIFGPPAVGKMTVGYALAERTGFKLFHNHMTVELVLNVFPFGHPQFWKLVREFRRRIMEEVASSDLPGLIFTYVWALDDPRDREAIDRYVSLFEERGAETYFVELKADLAVRLERNASEFRLSQKPSKRDLVLSRAGLLDADSRYKLNSTDDFFYRDNYLMIDNTCMAAEAAAELIISSFGFDKS